jgi:histidine ammonia-lyase
MTISARPLMRYLLDGRSLDVSGLVALARRHALADIDPAAIDEATRAGAALASQPAYGRSTGVGANREITVAPGDHGHALRLWLSHAGASGPQLDEDAVRAMLVIRLNQILTGRTGVSAACARAVWGAVQADALPVVKRYGSVGTGDLSALASLGLCLAGRRPWWRLDGVAPAQIEPEVGDGPALMSSNALTVGLAALAVYDLAELSRAAVVVTALSGLAAGASPEAFAGAVWADRYPVRPDPGSRPGGSSEASPESGSSGRAWVAATLSRLLIGPGRRLQDPYPLRAAPAWHGPLVTAINQLSAEVRGELNRSPENPLVDEASHSWLHNAAVISTELAARIDGMRAALVLTANGSLSRTRMLHIPNVTGLAPFLAAGPAPSSGTMICEYSAAAAVADLAQHATPNPLAWTTLSLGQEDGAGFATQAALAARDAVNPFRAVLAAELVVAGRALRLGGWPAQPLRAHASSALADIADSVLSDLPSERADHDLDPDLDAALHLLPALAAAVP